MLKNRYFFLLITCVSLAMRVETGHALKSDKEQPIEVSADSAERDERLATTTYTGNVEIKQGSLHIQADQVIIKTIISKKSAIEELHEIITTGQPAHFKQQIKVEGDLVDATANTILYRVTDKKVDLIDNAVLKQQGRVISGDKISYDVSAQRVTANSQGITGQNTGANTSEPKKPGRVTVIIPPKPKEGNTSSNKP